MENLRISRRFAWIALGLGVAAGSAVVGTLNAGPPKKTTAPAEDSEQALTQRLTALGNWIAQNPEAPQLWRYEMEQAQVLIRLASYTRPEERENWLRMAVDSAHSAALQSPENEPLARFWFHHLSEQLAGTFPGTQAASYAAYQVIRADYDDEIAHKPEAREIAQDHLRLKLSQFARVMPQAKEAPEAALEAAKLAETLGKPEDARLAFAFFADQFPSHANARAARLAANRLGLKGSLARLELPYLFPAPAQAEPFDIARQHCNLTVVYFWSTEAGQAGEDFRVLRQLTDRLGDRGLEVVYVNLDQDAGTAQTFLSERLTRGVHLYLKDGLQSPIAENWGLESAPRAFLVNQAGVVLTDGLKVAELEAAVATQLAGEK